MELDAGISHLLGASCQFDTCGGFCGARLTPSQPKGVGRARTCNLHSAGLIRVDGVGTPPKIAQVNDLHINAVKVQGEFVWHKHDNTDEVFFVHRGELTIRYRDGDVIVSAGELHVVPRGVEHITLAERECEILLVEPPSTLNTGDAAENEKTAHQEPWI
jgi:mannose-6-phosphate isomerase-like protein (cupin superfamily)